MYMNNLASNLRSLGLSRDYPKPFKRMDCENESNDQTEVHVDFVNFENKQGYGQILWMRSAK